jgi:hypothetical protein
MPCTSSTKIEPDSRGTGPGMTSFRIMPNSADYVSSQIAMGPSDPIACNYQPLKVGWRGCTQSLKISKSFHTGSGASYPGRGA